MSVTSEPPRLWKAGLLRRLAAISYDSLLLLAVLFIATVLVLPLNGGVAIRHNPFFSSYLFVVCFLFYGWFWTHGGQTLGMRAWKLRLQRRDGGVVTWWQALARFLLACLWLLPLLYARRFLGLNYKLSLLIGLIFLFLLLLTRLHERYSETVLVYMPAAASTVEAGSGRSA
ncbi:MAG: RDD family protein [Candidatus Competibacteraceae bacterium]